MSDNFINPFDPGFKDPNDTFVNPFSPDFKEPSKPSTKRTFGEAATDVAAGAVTGLGGLAKFVPEMYGLASGNFSDTGVMHLGNKMQEYGKELESPGLKERKRQREEKVNEAEKSGQISSFLTDVKETAKDPFGLGLNFIAEQLPQQLPALVAGLAGPEASAGVAAARDVARRAVGTAAEKEAARIATEAAVKAGTKAAIGTGAIQQGTDVGSETYNQIYEKLKADKVPENEAREKALEYARVTGAAGAAISLIAQTLPGGKRFEEALAGAAGKYKNRFVNAGMLALGELPSEEIEEIGGQLAQNIAQKQIDPNASLTENLGRTASQALLGTAGTAGGMGLLQKQNVEEPTPPSVPKTNPVVVPPKQIVPPSPPITPPGVSLPKLPAPPKTPLLEGPTPEPPAEPPTNPGPPPEDLTKNDLAKHFKDYHLGLPENSDTIFQNRDRSTPAAIGQMSSIAGDPDYGRLSTSRTFGQGAPVVITDKELSEKHMGKYEMTSAEDGSKIPVRYAVVEASEITPSHDVSGSKIENYSDMTKEAVRPVAGNGRVAGIQASYDRGTGKLYKESLLQDDDHGISKEAIANMKEPVLVRVMPKKFVTPNIADISNISGISELSAVDQAKQDAQRVDINGLDFDDDGVPTVKAQQQFIDSMPVSEQPGLKNSRGQPSPKAIDRLMNAVFWQAFGHEPLIDLYGATVKPEAKMILNALGKVAPKFAKLEGAGIYDIRPIILEAAETAVNAKRMGIKLSDIAKQSSIGTNEHVPKVLQALADAGLSGKKMVEFLDKLATSAYEEHTRSSDDLFGSVPKRTLEEIFEFLKEENNQEEEKKREEEEKKKREEEERKKREEEENAFFQKPELSRQEVFKKFENKNIVEAAETLVEIAHDSYSKGIAEKILNKIRQYDKRGVPMTFGMKYAINRKKVNVQGGRVFTYRVAGKIHIDAEINELKGSTWEIIAHELIHVVSVAEISYLGDNNPHVKELNKLREIVKKQWNKDKKSGKYNYAEIHSINYAFYKRKLSNYHAEFITQGLTDPAMQKYLASVKVGDKTALGKLEEWIRKVLNLSPDYETALDKLIKISSDLIDTPASQSAKEFEKIGLTLGVPTTQQPPPGRPKSNPKTIFESREDVEPEGAPIPPSQATGAGKDALDMLKDMDREVAPPDATVKEKLNEYWNNVKDNPTTKAKNGWDNFTDYVETKVFSSDAALNNKIRKGILDSNLDISDKIRGILGISLSQTIHADALGNLFLVNGNIKFDAKTQKWEAVKSKNNFVELSKKLDDLAAKHNMTKEEAELVAHFAFEAKRTKSLVKFNETLKQNKAYLKQLKENIENIPARSQDPAVRAQREQMKELIKELEKRTNQTKKIIHLTDDQIDSGMELFKNMPELNSVVDTWNGIRENTVRLLVDTGLWSEEEADFMMSNADYVPFYRDDQIERNAGPKEFLSGLMVKAKEPGFKGSQKPVHDIFDNMVRWTQYAVNRSVRNNTATSLVDAAMAMGLANKIPRPNRDANNVRIWRDGKEEFYNMADPLFVDAFNGLAAISIPTVKYFSAMANFLRKSVVLNPLFGISQVPQDAFAAIFTSGLKPQYALRIPALAVKEFVKTLRRTSTSFEDLKKVGAAGVADFSSHAARMDAEIYAGLKAPPGGWGKVKSMLNHISMASDNAVRQAVYEATLAQYGKDPKTKPYAKSLALEKAFEVINFRRRGSSKAIMFAGQVIPFFNAYLAAQHVAYKTITGVGISPTERKAAFETLIATTGSVMALSFLYSMMNGDDDDYNRKPTTVRDRLLMIPGTGGLSIPLRADWFTMPKIIAEHLYLLMSNNATEDGRKFRDSIASGIENSTLFSMSPQAIKPLLEIQFNKDFFQGTPLINQKLLNEETSRQYNDSTSEIGKLIGQTGAVAPINADHFIRGYFGTFGGLALMLTNQMINSDAGVDAPSMSLNDAIASVPSMSGFMSKENANGFKKDFYILKDEVDKVAATYQDIKKRSPQEIEEYVSRPEVQARLGMYKSVDRVGKNLAKIRQQISYIRGLPNEQMDSDKKQETIKNLKDTEIMMLKSLDLKSLRAQAQL